MKNLIKSLLATVMLMGIFSTTAYAWVDCSGLQGYKSNYGNWDHDKGQCESFQLLYGNTDRDWYSKTTNEMREHGVEYGNNGQKKSSYKKPVKKVVEKKVVKKTTMTMDEIRAFKFSEAKDGYRTNEKNLIAKILIEKLDLWNAYRVAGGSGVRYVLEKNGLGGHSETNYRPHAGNIFIYIEYYISKREIKKKLKIKFSDFPIMGIDPDDFLEGRISTEEFMSGYTKFLKKKIKDGITTKREMLESL